jgi:hypothetical protein
MFSRMVVGEKWEVESAWLVWEEVDVNRDLFIWREVVLEWRVRGMEGVEE